MYMLYLVNRVELFEVVILSKYHLSFASPPLLHRKMVWPMYSTHSTRALTPAMISFAIPLSVQRTT
jgi:hypothetical protein